MELTFDGESVTAGRAARERFYDSRGYGTPQDGDLVLDPVEATHLLYRGDIDTVTDSRQSSTTATLDFHGLLGATAVSEVDFFVYKDLRDRGFYLSPATSDTPFDFEVYPRGDGPWDETVAYRVLVAGERTEITTAQIRALLDSQDATVVLAVVDEESEVTYLEIGEQEITGSSAHDLPEVTGELLADRVLVWEPPAILHEQAFYGQWLDTDSEPVQLSLVEAAYLARAGLLRLGETGTTDDETAIIECGRTVEGDRFDRRLRVYAELRDAGVVPKTGFKFGADFRTYANVQSVDDLGHSEYLVRVLPDDHIFDPRDLALDVRLAHGVRKTMLFALVDTDSINWISVTRLTP